MDLRPIDTSRFAAIEAPPEFGPVPDQRWLPIAKLMVDPSYQREIAGLGRKNVRRIAEGFSWCKFSPVICSPIAGGLYAIIDGQHRTTAAALLGFPEVPCQIVVAGRREQAEAFGAINGNTTAMTGQALFAARVASGDPVATEIAATCSGCGVEILRFPVQASSMQPGQTLATGTIQRIFARHGAAVLITTLKTIMESANGEEPGILRGPILSAVAEVLADHAEWREAGGKLIDAFDDLDLDDLYRQASAEASRRAGITCGVLLQAKLIDALDKRLG